MFYEERKIILKNGQEALLRSPHIIEGAELLSCLLKCYSETNYLLCYPEECDFTPQQEEAFISITNDSPTSMMIVCLVDQKIVANCMLTFNNRIKMKHRAEIAISILEQYWGLGIGTALFEAMIEAAKEKGVLQLELGVIDSNERAIRLYEKMGFQIAGTKPNAYILKDGSVQNEHFMIKTL